MTSETTHYSPANNKKITFAIKKHATFGQPKLSECFVNDIVYRVRFNVFFRKLIKYFMYFRMKFALFFVLLTLSI